MVSVVCPFALVDHLKIITHKSSIAASLVVEDKSIVTRAIRVFEYSLTRLRALKKRVLCIGDSCHRIDILFSFIFILLSDDFISFRYKTSIIIQLITVFWQFRWE